MHARSGKLHFAYPSTQQHLIVWKSRPETVMIIVKLGNELVNEFMEVSWDGRVWRMHVVNDPSRPNQGCSGFFIARTAHLGTAQESSAFLSALQWIPCRSPRMGLQVAMVSSFMHQASSTTTSHR
eukprot:1148655-Pelagomonas_calceolata.AAC.7